VEYYKSKNELYFSAVLEPALRAQKTGWLIGYQGGEVIKRAKLLRVDLSKGNTGISLCKDFGILTTIKISKEEFDEAYKKAKKILDEIKIII
jgi:hypothetical protein